MPETRKSRQRDLILKIVRESTDHPTADMIYRRARESMPNISLGTIYRDLTQLVLQEEIKSVSMSGGAIRYDFEMTGHGHFFCKKCQTLTDIDKENRFKEFIKKELGNYDIEDYNVVITGICPTCNEK